MMTKEKVSHTPGQDTVCDECGGVKKWVAQEFPKLSYWEPCPLHAVANELLEAAKEAAQVLNQLWIKGRGNNDALLTLVHKVEAAIAKAEGR